MKIEQLIADNGALRYGLDAAGNIWQLDLLSLPDGTRLIVAEEAGPISREEFDAAWAAARKEAP